MKYQNLFSGKNKKNISVCLLLKILPRVLSVGYCTILSKVFRSAILVRKLEQFQSNHC